MDPAKLFLLLFPALPFVLAALICYHGVLKPLRTGRIGSGSGRILAWTRDRDPEWFWRIVVLSAGFALYVPWMGIAFAGGS